MGAIKSISFLIPVFILGCGGAPPGKEIIYPESKKGDVVDDYHGTKVPDPYRWLETDTSSETKNWIKAQNELTFQFLEKIPFRDTLIARLTALQNYERSSAPRRIGPYFFTYRNTGLQNQSVIFRRFGINGNDEEFIDPNKYSPDGTTSVRLSGSSNDDSLVVFSFSEAGSDWRKMIVFEVKSGKSIGDTLEWIKFSGASWDNFGFYYSLYPEPKSGETFSGNNAYHSVYYHRIGDPQADDQLIYEDREHPGRYHWTSITEDQAYLILYIAEGTDGFECHYKKLTDKHSSSFMPLFTGFRHKSTIVDHSGGNFLVRTDIDAPNYRLVSIDIEGDQTKLTDVIPEGASLLHGVSTAGGFLFANYLENASSKVYQMDYSGNVLRQVNLPEMGSVDGFDAKKEDSLIFYTFSSFTQPGSVYKFNPVDGSSSIFFEPKLSFKPSEYVIDQVSYQSLDETEVSMFLVYKKGVRMDGNNPCWLYGYGGFNISLSPGFRTSRIPWLENGGIFAMPNLRGGGEYGEEWHKAGMLLKKQNVFDDFIAAAEYLINKKFTSSGKLVIEGRSNGGLLVGAAMTQRPDLMRVALPGVGVMDMLRYHKFTVGHGWIPEYGSSDDKGHFDNLYSYSPLHNIKRGAEYPATLIYTRDHDDRVVPAHSFKFAATLQEAQGGNYPVLIRIETQAGHGSGKPVSKQLEEEVDKLAFAFYNTNFAPYIPR